MSDTKHGTPKRKQRPSQYVKNEVRFALETARALAASSRAINQSRAPKQGTSRPRKGPSQQLSMGTIRAPVSNAFAARNLERGLPNMRMTVRWDAGNLCVGNGTVGQDGALILQPQGATASTRAIAWVPIAPGDATGYGSQFMADVLAHYARVKYHRIRVHCCPWGLGASTTNQQSFIIAPFRGNVSSWGSGVVTATDPYAFAVATGTTVSTLTPAGLQGCKGSYTGPVWQPFTLDLSPYIAGGSGPAQNEFNTFANQVVRYNPSNIPCAFGIIGQCGLTSVGLQNNVISMQVVVEAEMEFLDFVSGVQTAQTIPIGAPEAKSLPDVKSDIRPPPLSFRDVVRRRDEASSPTQSLLGAELHTTHVVPAAARASSAAMPIPERKPRGT